MVKDEIFRIFRLRSAASPTIRPLKHRMANPKSHSQLIGRAMATAAAWMSVGLSLMANPGLSDMAAREQNRRIAAVDEAQELLLKGDEAYQAGRYSEALEAYAGARELFPNAPVSSELRRAATERYAQASIEHAKELSRKGDVPAAKAAMDRVLADAVAPNDPAALAYRSQLDDPIRTNPALTADHAKDIDAVRRQLYTAQGAFDLGKFDEAKKHYNAVLRVDPTNAAARRGMERLAATRSGYYQSAYDHARAEMLAQVDAGWELQVPPLDPGIGDFDAGAPGILDGGMTVSKKLERIMIPKIALDQASLEEALDLLRLRAAENDTFELNPARKGVNITLNLGPQDSEAARLIREQRITLQLSNVPLSRVLRSITEMTRTSYSTDDFAVILRPVGTTSEELVSRTFRVPPDFINSLSSGATDDQAASDPFAEAPAAGGLSTTRLSAQQALARQGVSFPDGAIASYNAATNTLRVTNTATNIDFIEQLVEAMTQTEPVMVVVRVTMISTQRSNLEELGFDWLVSPFALNSQDSLFGAGGTAGNTGGRTAADFSSSITGLPVDPSATVSSGVITNGLRSGDLAIPGNSIDALVNNPERSSQAATVAPGILSLTGLFSDGEAQVIMRGLSQKKGVDMIANPSTVTRSGQASSISMVREFIYPTEYEPPELPNSVGTNGGGVIGGGGGGGTTPVTPATPTAFEKKDIGITLEVLPVVDAQRRYIDVTINPSFSDFAGFINYGSPINASVSGLLGSSMVEVTPNRILMPVFNSQRTTTQVTVADGSTIFIGGLMSQGIENVEDKVPVLGNLPWIGRLFTSKVSQPTTTAIVFMVNVELLDPTGRPYRDR
jgi:general secretion pathway protein D